MADEELAEVGVIGAREVAVAVEAVHLPVGEGEALRGCGEDEQPACERCDAGCGGELQLGEEVEELAQADGGEEHREGQGGQVEPVPVHLVHAHLDHEGHEEERDSRDGQLFGEEAAVQEGEGHREGEKAEMVEAEHLTQLLEPLLPDKVARTRLHVEGVGKEAAVVAVAPGVEGGGDGEDDGHPEPHAAVDTPLAGGLHEQPEAEDDGEDVEFGPGEAGAREEQRAHEVAALAVGLAGPPERVGARHGQEHRDGLLEARLGPEREAAGGGEQERAPEIGCVAAEAGVAPHGPGHHDEEGNGEAEGEPLADLEEVEAERLEGRHEHGPEEVGVALHPLAGVEDEPFAMDEVVGVTEGDVAVVFDELEHGQQADAEGDGREPLEPAGRRCGWLVGELRVGLAEEEQEQGEQHRAADGLGPALPGAQVGKQLREACGHG